jgi:DNA-binding MarR family transcriptional regulator
VQSAFSLTQLRTLYEMAQRSKTTAVELCKDLGLDAGYLSRILAGFQKAGLVEKRKFQPTPAKPCCR